jgi:DNA-binding MarR family transcriptional regulator
MQQDRELAEQVADMEQLMLRVSWMEQRRFAQQLSEFGLTVSQFFVLRSIRRREQHPTMSTLADETLQRCATMTGIVGRLVKMGLVTRQRDKHDRRRVLVELTPRGRALVDEVRHFRAQRLGEAISRLPPGDARELLRLLRSYLEAFPGFEEAHAPPELPKASE